MFIIIIKQEIVKLLVLILGLEHNDKLSVAVVTKMSDQEADDSLRKSMRRVLKSDLTLVRPYYLEHGY